MSAPIGNRQAFLRFEHRAQDRSGRGPVVVVDFFTDDRVTTTGGAVEVEATAGRVATFLEGSRAERRAAVRLGMERGTMTGGAVYEDGLGGGEVSSPEEGLLERGGTAGGELPSDGGGSILNGPEDAEGSGTGSVNREAPEGGAGFGSESEAPGFKPFKSEAKSDTRMGAISNHSAVAWQRSAPRAWTRITRNSGSSSGEMLAEEPRLDSSFYIIFNNGITARQYYSPWLGRTGEPTGERHACCRRRSGYHEGG